eukprot:gnl/TRDRNA2_/TRDRNA2_121442_c1_seq1.p1 gnl/TRDRNA2_/TRDRNA2_121442_c1~~gnl/TRDRNA2_/TRDRNA2_121442_c1_seq1.p1  ORF type:complete len:140 (+),score=16.47 gnl/TRDRNA2_/TRDRNA2_121442_c1_seq1:64-420(+)
MDVAHREEAVAQDAIVEMAAEGSGCSGQLGEALATTRQIPVQLGHLDEEDVEPINIDRQVPDGEAALSIVPAPAASSATASEVKEQTTAESVPVADLVSVFWAISWIFLLWLCWGLLA